MSMTLQANMNCCTMALCSRTESFSSLSVEPCTSVFGFCSGADLHLVKVSQAEQLESLQEISQVLLKMLTHF